MINLFYPTIFKEEWLQELEKTFSTRWIGQGPKVAEFEQKFGEEFVYEYVLGLNSGSAALELAYDLVDIKENDKVISTVLTCSASHIPLARRKANIIFADIDINTFNMSFDSLLEKFTDNTKAIVVVNLGGIQCDKRIFEFAKEKNIPVIVDACQSLGISELHGDYICYSLQAIKHFSCFPKGTKITIPRKGKNGPMSKNIEELLVGDEVLTYNELTSQKEVKKITNTFVSEYSDELIKIKTSNFNELEMTKEHPVYVVGKGWTEADSLEIGDKVIQYKYYGLVMRLNGKKQKNKSVEEIFGEEKGKEIREKHSKRMSGENHHNFGKHLSDDTKQKISNAEKGKIISKETRERMSSSHKIYWENVSEEYLRSFCEKMSKINRNPEMIEKRREATNKLNENESYKESLRDGVRQAMKEYEYWVNYYNGKKNKKKSNLELKLECVLKEFFPNEFEFNGNFELNFVLDRFTPDFVNINGKQKLIEVFGNYWHSRRNKNVDDQIKERREVYEANGYECLFILEDEFKNLDKIRNKIETFIYNPNIEIVEIVEISKDKFSGKVYNIETEDNHNYFAYGILVHNCSDGGVLVTRNKEDHERAKRLRWFGIDREQKINNNWKCLTSKREMCMDMYEAGYKFHMNDVMATLALVGLRHSDGILKKRKKICEKYYNAFKDYVQCIYGGSCWLFGILVNNREEFESKLLQLGVESDPVHLRNDIFTIFGGKRQDLPNMNYIEYRYTYLPLHYNLSDDNVDYVIENTVKVLKETDNKGQN